MKNRLSAQHRFSVFCILFCTFAAASPVIAATYMLDVTDHYSFTLGSSDTGGTTEKVVKAFNNQVPGDRDNKWFENTTTPYVTITFDTPQLINGYTFTTANNNNEGEVNRQPTGWSLFGWSDSADDWILIDSRSGIDRLAGNATQTYLTLKNQEAYSEYKFEFAGVQSGTMFQLAQIQLNQFLTAQDATNFFSVTASYDDASRYRAVTQASVLFDNRTDGNAYKAEVQIREGGETDYVFATPETPWVVNFQFPDGVTPNVIGYNLISANDADYRDPSTWTLVGRNGGAASQVGSMTDGWFGTRQGSWTFLADTPGKYNDFTLTVTGQKGTGDYVATQLGEIELLEALQINRMQTDRHKTAVTATSQHPSDANELASSVWDGATGTKWYSPDATPTLTIDLGTERNITRYALTAVNEGAYPGRNPQSWTLQGFDGTGWQTIDTRTGISFLDGSGQTQYFEVATPGKYSQYQLVINSNNTGATGDANFQLAEIQLFETTNLYNLNDFGRYEAGFIAVDTNRTLFGNEGADTPSKLVDRALGTNNKMSTSEIPLAGDPVRVVLEFSNDQQFSVQEYAFGTANDSAGSDPLSWIVYGTNETDADMNDLNQWDVLDEINLDLDLDIILSSARNATFSFTLDNDQEYSQYMFEFLSTVDETTALFQLGEIQLYAPLGVTAANAGSGVPEPATWFMLLAGMAGLMFIRRKQH